jgi:hypothetical protein
MLAIGTYILSKALGDEKLLRRIKTWSQMKEFWEENRKEVDTLRKAEERVQRLVARYLRCAKQ